MSCDQFVPSKPGLAWGGMLCKTCNTKKSDHATEAQVVKTQTASQLSSSAVRHSSNTEAKKKALGQKPGSLAAFMGESKGIKHTGKSTGMIKQRDQGWEKEAVSYHKNKEANKGMANMFGQLMMTQRNADGSMKRASEVAEEERQKRKSIIVPPTTTEPASPAPPA